MAASNNSQLGDRGHFSGEVSAQVVTQSRDSLIGAAVHFLRHPRVARATSSQLRTFLLQKGLTPDEVDESFHRALKHLNSAWSMVGFGSSFTALSPTMDKLLRRHSWLAVFYDISRVLLVLTGGGYLVFYIVQYYVIPWLTGQRLGYKASQSSSTLTPPAAASARDASCPQQLSAGRPAGDSRRDQQQQQLVASEVSDLQQRLGQLSTEVSSLRSLLLSREQFPSLPAVPRPPALKSASTAAATIPPAAATVPSWQLVCRPAIGSDDETAAAATATTTAAAAAADNGDASCEADGCGEEQSERRQQQQLTAAAEEQQQRQHEQHLLMSNKAGSSSSSAEIIVVSEHNSDELSDS